MLYHTVCNRAFTRDEVYITQAIAKAAKRGKMRKTFRCFQECQGHQCRDVISSMMKRNYKSRQRSRMLQMNIKVGYRFKIL